jgi:hypothetical protein
VLSRIPSSRIGAISPPSLSLTVRRMPAAVKSRITISNETAHPGNSARATVLGLTPARVAKSR